MTVPTEVVYLQRCLVVTWLVPLETAAVSAHVLFTPHNHAPMYNVTSFQATYVGCMCVKVQPATGTFGRMIRIFYVLLQ